MGPELAIISAAMSAFQGFQAYQQGKAQAKSATSAAAYNARVIQQQSDVKKSKLKRSQRLFAGKQRARAAATGATLGSFEDVFEDTEAQSLLDVALLDYDTRLRKDQALYGGQQAAYSARSKGRDRLISGLSSAAMGIGSYGSGFTTGAQTNYAGQAVGTYQIPYGG